MTREKLLDKAKEIVCKDRNQQYGEPEECVVQYHPPKSEYVNAHPNCLHLWRPVEGEYRMPPKFYV